MRALRNKLARRCVTRMRVMARRLKRKVTGNEQGTTTLEWILLLGGIAIPSYFIMLLALNILIEHYRMITMINSMPVP